MTEQGRPRTEAGQSILDVIGEALGYPVSENEAWQRRVTRIEAEGRQQAVRDHTPSVTRDAELYCSCGWEEWMDHSEPPHDRWERHILDRVAGLNASESPLHEGGPLCIDCDKPFQHLGDASESPQTHGRCAICDTGEKAHGVMDHPFTQDEVVYEEGGEQVVIRRRVGDASDD